MTNSPSQEPVDLSDPSISAHRLQELAQTHPQLWDEILRHPNVYPGLADWIRTRQAEQAATAPYAPMGSAAADDAAADAETLGTLDDAELDAAAQPDAEPVDAHASEPAPEAETEAMSEEPVAPWAMPEASTGQQDNATESTTETRPWEQEPAVPFNQPEQSPQEPTAQDQQSTWAAPSGYQQQAHPDPAQSGYSSYGQSGQPGQQGFAQQQYGQYGRPPQAEQQHYGQPQQFGQSQQFGQQQPFGQPQYYAPRRSQSAGINLSSARTWGLLVAGGAAFLSLFGFFFSATLRHNYGFSSQVGGGGWLILLLFLATITLSLLQLLRPSEWMRYFFLVVSFGAAFAMIGRAITLMGLFAMTNMSFSVVWLLFMSLVLLAGTMVYLAPSSSDTTQQQNPGQQAGGAAPNPAGYGQPQPGAPFEGYGQQPGSYPPGGQQY